MTTSNFQPSYPPVDDAINLIRSVDTDQLLRNVKRAGGVATDCLVWAAALIVLALQHGRKLLPHLASFLRAVADHIDPDSAPLTEPMTARDIPDTLEFFMAREIDRMQVPAPAIPTDLSIDEDLAAMSKAQLMAEYGTKSRRMTKEQLQFKIMQVRALCQETA